MFGYTKWRLCGHVVKDITWTASRCTSLTACFQSRGLPWHTQYHSQFLSNQPRCTNIISYKRPSILEAKRCPLHEPLIRRVGLGVHGCPVRRFESAISKETDYTHCDISWRSFCSLLKSTDCSQYELHIQTEPPIPS